VTPLRMTKNMRTIEPAINRREIDPKAPPRGKISCVHKQLKEFEGTHDVRRPLPLRTKFIEFVELELVYDGKGDLFDVF
jgi:hypothetical protein